MKKNFEELLDGYLHNKLSTAELRQFLDGIQQEENAALLHEKIQALLEKKSLPAILSEGKANEIFEKIIDVSWQENPTPAKVVRMNPAVVRIPWKRIIVAASIVACVSLSGYFWMNHLSNQPIAKSA